MLTKTEYLQFLCCPQEFWLKRTNPELFHEALDIAAFHRFEEGKEFEAVARKLSRFKPVDGKFTVEFQRVFETEDLYSRSDAVLTDAATGEVSIYEIKASGKPKKEHYEDLAFQKHTAQLAGVQIARSFLVTVNTDYVKNGEISADEICTVTDVTAEVDAILPETILRVARAFEYLKQAPEPNLADHCGLKLDCKFLRHHFPDLPEYTIFEISRLDPKKRAHLLNAGVIDILNVPADFVLSDKQRRQVDVAQSGNAIVETVKIKERIEDLAYPICFLDYETVNCAIPLFDGIRPFQQMPFQYSLHILDSPDSTVQHYEYLSPGTGNPSLELAEKLSETLSGRMGTVVVWSKGFETGRNTDLGGMFPQFASFFEELNAKTFDLMKIFSEELYVHPKFKGSASLKDVVPVLCPRLSYDDLEIKEGSAASIHWFWVASQRFDEQRNREICADLRKYCQRDTFATVKIYKFLKNL